MSRIGKQPVAIPQGVKIQVENGLVRAEGPKGKLSQPIPSGLSVKVENNAVVLTREADDRQARALHGTARALGANMVNGVKAGFQRKHESGRLGSRRPRQGKSVT